MAPAVLTAVRRCAAAVLAGIALGLAFPPLGWWPLALAAIAGFAVIVRGRSVLLAAVYGWCFGFAFFLTLMPWLRIIGTDGWVGLAAFEALFYAGLGAAVAWVSRLRWWPLAAGCCWVAAEWLRSSFPWGGYPWGRLEFAFADSPIVSWTRYVGGEGLMLLLVTATLLVVYAAIAATPRWRRIAGGLTGVLVLAVAAVLPVGVAGDATERASVATVQGSVPGRGLTPFDERRAVLQNHVRATHQLADRVRAGDVQQPDAVIWPENSTDIDPYRDARANAAISGAVEDIGAPTLVGAVAVRPGNELASNIGVVWEPERGPGQTYAKRHLVPFGEYIPMRSLLEPRIGRLSLVGSDRVPGNEPGALRMGGLRVGDVICFEVAYDYVVRDVVAAGAQLIVVQTNNATYQGTGQLEQQWAISRMRAIETGRAVVVAATSGVSGIVLPDGRVVDRSEDSGQFTLVADVPLASGMTLGTRIGAWVEATAGALAVAAVAWTIVLVRRRRPAAADASADREPVRA